MTATSPQNAPNAAIDAAGLPFSLPTSTLGYAFFIDVDGTLIDIAPTPDSVFVPPGLAAVLTALGEGADGAVALVSGRSIATLDRLIGVPSLAAAGLHGGELRLPGGTVEAEPPPPALARLRPGLAALVERLPGTMLEDKGAAIAVHYRGNPAAGPDVLAAIEAMLPSADGTLTTMRGKMVVELKPSTAGKGQIVGRLMGSPPFAGRRPVAIGDDVTDEAMFNAVNAMGGLSIRVGLDDRPTEAAYRLPDSDAVRAWISSLSHSGSSLAAGT